MRHLTILLMFDKKTENALGRLARQAACRWQARWKRTTYMTHTRTVHYPFHLCLTSRLSPKQTKSIIPAMRALARKTKRFPVTFDRFGMFGHTDLKVLFMAPSHAPQLLALHNKVMKTINTITPHRHTYATYTPHLTIVAEHDAAEQVFAQYAEWRKEPLRLRATATHLGVLLADENGYRIRRFAL
jgi:2'-5' RNA ligase